MTNQEIREAIDRELSDLRNPLVEVDPTFTMVRILELMRELAVLMEKR